MNKGAFRKMVLASASLWLITAGTAGAITRADKPRSVTQLVFIPGPLDGQPAIPIGKQTWSGKPGDFGKLMASCRAAIAADQGIARPYDRYEMCVSDTVIPATPGAGDDRPALFDELLKELDNQ